MKTPFLHLAKRLATATPASWFPACLQEASGYVPARDNDLLTADATADQAITLCAREERVRARHLASAGALFSAPGYPPFGGVLVLPANDGFSPVTAADDLRRRLLGRSRMLLDAALTDPRLLAHVELGAPSSSIAGAAALQFLRERHAVAVGHFLLGSGALRHGDCLFDATSVCVQIAGLPPNLVLWLAAAIAEEAGAPMALVVNEDEGCTHSLERLRPPYAQIH